MDFIKATIVIAFAVTTIDAASSSANAAPLPTNVAAMKEVLNVPVLQVRYGRWAGGYRGWAGGYRGWGYRGYRGWGGVAAGAVVGGAIARSAYYGGGYPYYDDGYAYSGSYAYGDGYASDYCAPYGSGGYYPRYGAARHYYGW